MPTASAAATLPARRCADTPPPLPPAEAPSADVLARLSAAQREALDALAVLPPRERLAFSMIHLDEAPLKEVAAALSCSVSYACKLAQRAEERLAQHGWRQTPRARTADNDWEAEVSLG